MPSDSTERRDKGRFPGQILFLQIGLKPYPIIDISIGGIGFEAEGLALGDMVHVRIVSVLDKHDFAEAVCEVVKVDAYRVAAHFVDPSLRLLNFVDIYLKQWN